jgi:phosphate transport system protein
METHFDRMLEDLKRQLLEMASSTEESIGQAVRALAERDDDLARQVIAGGKTVDAMEVRIEDQALGLLALRQPVARDLRLVAAIIKMNTDLERINDQAVNIAQRALVLNALPPLKPIIDLPRMATIAQALVRDALTAFVYRDAALAHAVRQRDDELDDLKDQVFRELLTYMMASPTAIDRAVHLIVISRCLERMGDHASNIAEDALYVVEGHIVRHTKEQNAQDAAQA